MPVYASTPVVPFEVSGHSLVTPGPRIHNTIAAAPALLYNDWTAQSVAFTQATSIAGAQTFGTLPNLLKVEYPNVSDVASTIAISTAPNLQVFSIAQGIEGGITAYSSTSIAITGAKLTVESVNNLLIQVLAVTPAVTSGTINLSGGTSAAPTGLGLAAKTALTTAGMTITTN